MVSGVHPFGRAGSRVRGAAEHRVAAHGGQHQLGAFASTTTAQPSAGAPKPSGGTFVDLAVDAIAERTETDPARDMYPRLVAAVIRAVGETAMRSMPTPIRQWPLPNSFVAALPMSRPDYPKGDADVRNPSPRCYLRCRPEWADGGVRAGAGGRAARGAGAIA